MRDIIAHEPPSAWDAACFFFACPCVVHKNVVIERQRQPTLNFVPTRHGRDCRCIHTLYGVLRVDMY